MPARGLLDLLQHELATLDEQTQAEVKLRVEADLSLIRKKYHVFLDEYAACGLKLQYRRKQPSRKFRRDSGPIAFLEKAQLLFGRETRNAVSRPVIEELREDYIVAKQKCTTSAARKWAYACFAWRAFVAFGGCVRCAVGGLIGRMVPLAWRVWSQTSRDQTG